MRMRGLLVGAIAGTTFGALGSVAYALNCPGTFECNGTNAAETIVGSIFGERIQAFDGSDVVYANDGADEVYGGNGNDHIEGREKADYIAGGSGGDKIYGNANDDQMTGGDGEDTMEGGTGTDYLYAHGDGKSDVVSGGPDTDYCYIVPSVDQADASCDVLRFQNY